VNCFNVRRAGAAQLSSLSNQVHVAVPQFVQSTVMDTHINIKALPYAELMELGKLAAEAIELSREYDQSHARKFCNLIAACNVEMIERRRQAERLCGTAMS
jgi:hypothetical protein